jgi:pyoverdine/dityrosine biosynthesis protein Dit1
MDKQLVNPSHGYRLHSLERHWSKCPPGHSFRQERVERYDPINGLFHSPTEYYYVPIASLVPLRPADEDIGQFFQEFVRGEFGSKKKSRGACPVDLMAQASENISYRTLLRYLEVCERQLVWSGLAGGIVSGTNRDMVAQLGELLSSPLLGNKDNAKLSSEEWSATLQPLVSQQHRVCFIVPGFPFKDQNPFRTAAHAGHVDLGEIALLIRLHVLTMASFQVHPFGVDWLIVSDGHAYAPILRIDDHHVNEYQRQLRLYRDLLNIYGSVSILELTDLCAHLGTEAGGEPIFDVTKRYVSARLRELIGASSDIATSFNTLVRGVKWNMNFQDIAKDRSIDRSTHWLLLDSDESTARGQSWEELWKLFDNLARDAALAYASFNLTIRFHKLFESLFPQSIRATTHAKKGQIAVPELGEVTPWNGVAFVRGSELSATSVVVEPLYRLARYGSISSKAIRSGEPPLYYQTEP